MACVALTDQMHAQQQRGIYLLEEHEKNEQV